MKLELALLAAVGGCSTFSTDDTAGDAGTISDAGGATFCEAARGQVGGAFQACEDFEGPPGAGGFQRAQQGLTIVQDNSLPDNGTHSGHVVIAPDPNIPGQRKGSLLITAGQKLHYHLEGRVKIEGSVGTDGVVLLTVKLLSLQNHEGSAYLARLQGGAIHQVCASPLEGGAVLCVPSPIPDTFQDWTRIAVDFDASTGDIVFTVGTAQYPHKLEAAFGSVASADIELGAVSVLPASGSCVVHMDDVFVAIQ